MALIVEDGTGRADAESLASVAEADVYHTARGNEAAWTDLDIDVKERYLRLATDYMAIYRTKWKGRRASLTQALDWPRYDVQLDDVGCGRYLAYVPVNTVPKEVIQATCAMALKAAGGELAPDLQRQVIAKTVGPIKTEWAPGSPEYVRYRAIDLLLRPLLSSSGMGVKLVRA
jgi:hypothetical protein